MFVKIFAIRFFKKLEVAGVMTQYFADISNYSVICSLCLPEYLVSVLAAERQLFSDTFSTKLVVKIISYQKMDTVFRDRQHICKSKSSIIRIFLVFYNYKNIVLLDFCVGRNRHKIINVIYG